MRAAVIRHGRIVVEELPTPVPGAGEVLVRTLACGICGSDLHLFEHGGEMMRMAESLGAVPDNLVDGLVLGHEFVAEVVRFGPDTAARLAPGTRVCALPFLPIDGVPAAIGASSRTIGAYAEYFLLPEAGLIPLPPALPTEAAALTEPLAIGVHAVSAAGPIDAETAVVIGCGPIGLACIAVLRDLGVRRILATDFSTRRLALARELGASEVINAAGGSLLAGRRFEDGCVVFECVGRQGLIGQIVRDAPAGARIVVAGISSQEESFLPLLAVSKELCIRFVSFYREAEFRQALEMLADGRVAWQSWITGQVDLEQVADAFDALRKTDRHAKILVKPGAGCELPV